MRELFVGQASATDCQTHKVILFSPKVCSSVQILLSDMEALFIVKMDVLCLPGASIIRQS